MVDFKQKRLRRAKIAGRAGRYDDMVAAMSDVVKTGQPLIIEESKLLNYAFKKVVDLRRDSWNAISSIRWDFRVSDLDKKQANAYREEIGKELTDICKSALQLLDEILIPNATDLKRVESLVFYLTMKGNFFRYLAEIATGTPRKELANDTSAIYSSAKSIADESLSPKSPIRLGLYLNYCVFMYEIECDGKQAFLLANTAFSEGMNYYESGLEELNDETKQIFRSLKRYIDVWKTPPIDD